MAELKTKPNDRSVEAFLNSVADEKKRQACYTILDLMKQATKSEPVMWGDASLVSASIITSTPAVGRAIGF
jgi:hypothetical protein